MMPFSRPKGRTERCCLPSLILSAAQNPLSLLLIYRATSKGSAGAVDTPRGAPPAFSVDEGGRPSRRWGVDLREDGGSTFVRGAKGRERGETAASFPHRAPVPAQRHRRSGATRTASRTESKLRGAAKGCANDPPKASRAPPKLWPRGPPILPILSGIPSPRSPDLHGQYLTVLLVYTSTTLHG